jgi:hypothetical protein
VSDLPRDDFESMSVFCNDIRQSALHLIHYQWSESKVIAAALLVCMSMPLQEQNLSVLCNLWC